MRITPLLVVVFFARIISSFAQAPMKDDSSVYKARKLKIEEVNIVSGYYMQDGNHSGVMGGIGTEELTDFANTIDLKLYKNDLKGNKHSLSFEIGVDTYTSASSDSIGPLTGPSRQDTRVYPSLSYQVQNDKKRITLGSGVSYSTEYDYQSLGINFNFSKTSRDHNREFGAHLFAYFDTWEVIYPYELRSVPRAGTAEDPKEGDKLPRNSFQASFVLSQVINERMQLAILFDPALQQGQLATLYQRVYFTDNSVRAEELPDSRIKIPIAIRLNYFAGDRFIIRAYYRFYQDDWGNTAHTTNLEIPVKLNQFFSLSPFYRFSKQTGIDYFAGYKEHVTDEKYYTSDYDLSPFSSHMIGAGIRIAPPKGIFGFHYWNSVEFRYAHYIRSTDLVANSISLALKFK
jgi:hypothetical protein